MLFGFWLVLLALLELQVGSKSTLLNNSMEQYLLAKARNTITGQTVKNQDLTGARFTLQQRFLAEDSARQLAEKMTARTGDAWVGFVESYTPTVRS
jgi:hypothetical protein